MASKCLRELIAEADERGLAASGLACLERCLPLLSSEAGALRPLWAGLARGAESWPGSLAVAREAMADSEDSEDSEAVRMEVGGRTGTVKDQRAGYGDGTVRGQRAGQGDGTARGHGTVRAAASSLVRQMLDAAPAVWAAGPLREWADDCSVAALELHHRFDAGPGGGEPEAADVVEVLKGCREGEPPAGAGPLVTGELRRQLRVLEILAAGDGGSGLRQVLTVSTEGQRVLRAVVSRRARVQS
ncbi:hypothetical protein [Streptomyces katsurahamanus]|uniref:Uncharacterized protein n=1 Tax=Streptomyces katsurahamanus TaxID=2577098 RepID=A0ABW9NVR2_9ACTN|nr:hypothetical protein [Streptomyces katsurahamanus]MQS37403.1 hypothetical protein [Streptomyces katsurahamanus]